MLNNGNGHQINGGTFYNVAGNLEFRTHHHLDISSPAWGLGDDRTRRSHPQLVIQDQEHHEMGNDHRARGSERQWTGVARNLSGDTAMRPALYDIALRPCHTSCAPSSTHSHPDGAPAPDNSTSGAVQPMDHSYLGLQVDPVGHMHYQPLEGNPLPSVHSGTFITAANVIIGTKRRQQQNDDESQSIQRATKCRRRRDEGGIKIIRDKHLKLICQIGSGPGYFLHTGQNKGHAVIVKVFNPGPTVRQQLETTVALSKGLMHPNILRIEGISSSASENHFIAYEDVHWKNAEGPLAAALNNNLDRSITLGLKMIAGISAGMNYLDLQGLSWGSIGVENFDVFLDFDDRFLISINPRSLTEEHAGESQEPQDTSWSMFNALCRKVLVSANRVLHKEEIDRDPATLDSLSHGPGLRNSGTESGLPFGSASLRKIYEEPSVPPRREFVWRTTDRGRQSLATVAHQITLDLDMDIFPLRRFTQLGGQGAHRCAGYIREEITLATTTLDSAVVAHDTPSPKEICPICHEVVSFHEAFGCICGDPDPGSGHMIKCGVCELWSHINCVGFAGDFTCRSCSDSQEQLLGEERSSSLKGDESPLTPTLPIEDSAIRWLGVDYHVPSSSVNSPSPPTPTLSPSPSETLRALLPGDSAIREQRWLGVEYQPRPCRSLPARPREHSTPASRPSANSDGSASNTTVHRPGVKYQSRPCRSLPARPRDASRPSVNSDGLASTITVRLLIFFSRGVSNLEADMPPYETTSYNSGSINRSLESALLTHYFPPISSSFSLNYHAIYDEELYYPSASQTVTAVEGVSVARLLTTFSPTYGYDATYDEKLYNSSVLQPTLLTAVSTLHPTSSFSIFSTAVIAECPLHPKTSSTAIGSDTTDA